MIPRGQVRGEVGAAREGPKEAPVGGGEREIPGRVAAAGGPEELDRRCARICGGRRDVGERERRAVRSAACEREERGEAEGGSRGRQAAVTGEHLLDRNKKSAGGDGGARKSGATAQGTRES